MVIFKHPLVPVDGSPLAKRALEIGVDLAQQLGAAIAGFIPEPLPPAPPGPRSSALGEQQARENVAPIRVPAVEVLARFEAAAKAAGVPITGYHDHGARVDRAIIAAAEPKGCNMIAMVTHGRGAFGGFLNGSQTKAVWAGSDLPLLALHRPLQARPARMRIDSPPHGPAGA